MGLKTETYLVRSAHPCYNNSCTKSEILSMIEWTGSDQITISIRICPEFEILVSSLEFRSIICNSAPRFDFGSKSLVSESFGSIISNSEPLFWIMVRYSEFWSEIWNSGPKFWIPVRNLEFSFLIWNPYIPEYNSKAQSFGPYFNGQIRWKFGATVKMEIWKWVSVKLVSSVCS